MSWSEVATGLQLKPKTVVEALAEVENLHARLLQEREAVRTAQAALERVSAADVERMAQQARKGDQIESDVEAVERARSTLAEAERRVAAVEVAVTDAERDVGREIARTAPAWATKVRSERDKSLDRARSALAKVGSSLADLQTLDQQRLWLEHVPDRPRPVRPGGAFRTLSAPSSARRTANGEPVQVTELLAWLAAQPGDPRAGDDRRDGGRVDLQPGRTLALVPPSRRACAAVSGY